MMLYHFLETRFLVSLLRRNSFRTSPPELSNDAEGNLVYISAIRDSFPSHGIGIRWKDTPY